MMRNISDDIIFHDIIPFLNIEAAAMFSSCNHKLRKNCIPYLCDKAEQAIYLKIKQLFGDNVYLMENNDLMYYIKLYYV